MISQFTPWMASAAFVLMASLAVYVWWWREKLNKRFSEEDAAEREAEAMVTRYEEEARKNRKAKQKLDEGMRIEREKLEAERFAEETRRRQDAALTAVTLKPLYEKVDHVWAQTICIPPSSANYRAAYSTPAFCKFELLRVDLLFDPKLTPEELGPFFKILRVEMMRGNSICLPPTNILLFKKRDLYHAWWKFNNPVFVDSRQQLDTVLRFDGYFHKPLLVELVLRGNLHRPVQ